jgi:hypothetical protein
MAIVKKPWMQEISVFYYVLVCSISSISFFVFYFYIFFFRLWYCTSLFFLFILFCPKTVKLKIHFFLFLSLILLFFLLFSLERIFYWYFIIYIKNRYRLLFSFIFPIFPFSLFFFNFSLPWQKKKDKAYAYL